MMDFTISKYEEFLRNIRDSRASVYGVQTWLNLNPEYGVLLRHDVERRPYNALKIAELEREYNIKSTFYFRITRNSFNREVIKKIFDLGHEIGYHYEDLSLAKGNYDNAIHLFENHLKVFREIVPVTTIAMHGRPLSPYDNRDLWHKFDFESFGINGEAFLSIQYASIFYCTDTGRSWHPGSPNLRDKIQSDLTISISSTDELVDFITRNRNKKIAIVMHPHRWALNHLNYLFCFNEDIMVNLIKKILIVMRDKQ